MGWSPTACWRWLGGRPLPAAPPRSGPLRIALRPSPHLRLAARRDRRSRSPSAEVCWAGGDAGSSAMADRRSAGRPGSPAEEGGASANCPAPGPPPPGRPPQPPSPIRYARVRGYSRPFTSDPSPGCREVRAPGGGVEAQAQAGVSQWARGAGRGDVRRCRWSERRSAIRGRAVRGRAGPGLGGCPFCLGGFGASPTAPPPGGERSRRMVPPKPAGE